jgi:predicted ATPase
VLSLAPDLAPWLPALLSLLDAPVEDEGWRHLDAPQRRRRTLEAVTRLLLRESELQPLVVVFEDLHWIDSQSHAVLDALVSAVRTARILVLVTYRRQYEDAWTGQPHYRRLKIDALPTANAKELLDALLGDDASVEALKRWLTARTDGNPFLMEEIVRTLIETETLVGSRGAQRLTRPPESVEIPATAQAILAARIDRLEPEDKRMLQVASVVCSDVPFTILEAIADTTGSALRQSLTRLQAAEFLYEVTLFAGFGYRFKHALTHEVTYSGMLRERRRELSARIVGAMETLYEHRLGEHVERLAYHAVRGDLPAKALNYLREAGTRAATRSALQEAKAWFEQALTILDRLPETPATVEQGFTIRLLLRGVLSQLGEVRRLRARLLEAERLAGRLNDEVRRGRIYALVTDT